MIEIIWLRLLDSCMVGESNGSAAENDELPRIRCPECGSYIDAENYHPGDDFSRLDCENCGTTTLNQSYASRAGQIVDGEAEPEDVFPWANTDLMSDAGPERLELQDTEERDEVPIVGVDLSKSKKCRVEGCETTVDDLEDGETMRATEEAGPVERYCPDHFKEALEQGETPRRVRPDDDFELDDASEDAEEE